MIQVGVAIEVYRDDDGNPTKEPRFLNCGSILVEALPPIGANLQFDFLQLKMIKVHRYQYNAAGEFGGIRRFIPTMVCHPEGQVQTREDLPRGGFNKTSNFEEFIELATALMTRNKNATREILTEEGWVEILVEILEDLTLAPPSKSYRILIDGEVSLAYEPA
jgi:hypothetical protein